MSKEMKYSLLAIGSTEFTMGFRLTGINTIESRSDSTEIFEKILNEKEVGIIVTDEKTMESVDEKTRQKVQDSVKPVTVILSHNSSGQDALKKMIKKSLGVDLWKN